MIVRELITKLSFRVDFARLRAAERRLDRINTIVRRSTSNIRALGGTIAGIGAGITAAVTLPILGVGFAALKTSAGLEKARISLEVFLGTEEKAIALQKDLIQFAKETPFQVLGIQETAGELLAVGIEADKVVDTLNALGNAAKGDSAIFKRLVQNFGQVRTQGRLTGRDMLQFQQAAVPMTKLLAKTLGVSEKAIASMVTSGSIKFKDVERAFFEASKAGGFFFDLMKKQSKTLSGRFSNLQDAITVFLGTLGDAIDDAFHIKEVLAKLSVIIEKLGEKFKALNPNVKKFIVFLIAAVALIGPVVLLVGGLIIAFAALSAAAIALNVSLGVILLVIIAIIVWITVMGLAIFLLIDDFLTWRKGGDSAIGSILANFIKLKDAIFGIGKAIRDFWVGVWTDIVEEARIAGNQLLSVIPAPVRKLIGAGVAKLKSPNATAGTGRTNPSFLTSGPANLAQGTTTTVNVKSEITVPPGTTEQQQDAIKESVNNSMSEATKKMLNDALNANPRNEN